MIGYIKAIAFSLLTLPIVTHLAYAQRGYKAVGGEFLVPVLIITFYALYREFKPLELKNKLIKGELRYEINRHCKKG